MTQAHKSTLLVTEDASIIRQLGPVLGRLGLPQPEEFEDVRDAYVKLSKNPFYAFVFVDLRLPKSSAFTLIEFLASHAITDVRCIPIVGIVGAVSQHEVQHLGENSVLSFLMKPLTEKTLEAKLREIVAEYENPASEKCFLMEVPKRLAAGDGAGALEAVSKRISEVPRSVRFRLLRAKTLFQLGRNEEAQADLTFILKGLPDNVAALDLMGHTHIRNEQYLLALRFLERAQQLSPLSIERPLVIGELLLAAGRAALAEPKFKNVLSRCPGLELARSGLARCLAEQGIMDGAQELSQDPAINEKLVSHLNLKGVVLSKAGRFEDAVRMYMSAIQVIDTKAKKASLYYNVALAWNKAARYEKALNACKMAVANDPSNLKARQLLEKLKTVKPGAEGAGNPSEPAPLQFILPDETRNRIVTGLLRGVTPTNPR